MQMSWRSVFAVDGVAAALIVGGTLATLLLVSLVSHSTKKKKDAQASFHLNDEALEHEELVAQQLPNQKNGSVGSSMDIQSITVTCEDEAILGEAENMDRALGSPDKLLWTALSAFESDTDEISETEMQERKAQLKETERERVVRDDWYVYRREWVHFGKKIAEGGQAEIYAATVAYPSQSDEPPEKVAVKKFKTINSISQGHNPPGLKSIKCLNVCRPYGVFFDDGQVCLIMARLNGDLRTVIDRVKLHSAPPFPEPVAVHIIMQLAMGLKGLHEAGIYHRDLKAGNVLVEEIKVKGLDSYTVYISDFESSDAVIGTGFYRAPEVLRNLQVRAEAGLQGRARESERLPEHEWAAADVYSFGMVCYEILTGEVPMIGDKSSDFSLALSGHRPKLPPETVPGGLRILIERCWHGDPQIRPSPSEIIECLRMIDNSGAACDWFSEVEMMARAEVTTGNLEDHVLEFDHLLRLTMGLKKVLGEPNPELINAGTKFLMHVREFIPKFHALSHLPQHSFPLQKFMELRKLLSLIDWTKCSFVKETNELVASGDDVMRVHDWMRMAELMKKIHAATNKTSLQRSRLVPADGLPIDEKMAVLRDFVEPQLAAGVCMQYVCIESEIIIRQMSDTKHRWALRCHLFFLCVIHRLEIEVGYFIPFLVVFLLRSRVLGRILVRVFGKDYSLFWYCDMSPAIGYRLLLLRYIGARAHPLWYWRMLYYYIVGNGEGFKYIFLYDLVSNVVVNYRAFMQTDFSPHCDFQPINSSTY